MPETVGVVGTIRGREFYYNANVTKDDKLTFRDGSCIKNEMMLSVVDRNDRERVLQTIDVFTSCDERGINLGDRFGAFEFTGYACHDGNIQDCLKNLAFEVCAVNEKPEPLSLEIMELDFKGGVYNLLGDVSSLSVGENENPCFEERREISICRRTLDFEYVAYAEGSEASGLSCSAEASARFEVAPPGLPPLKVEITQVEPEPEPAPAPAPDPTREPQRDSIGKGGGEGALDYGRYYGRYYGRARGRAYGRAYAYGKGY
jgi:hypothetical protein